MLYQRDKRFSIENLLRKSQAKVWIATHQHVHHRISKSIKKMTEAIEKEKHAKSKRDINSCIGYYRVRINTDASPSEHYDFCSIFRKELQNCMIP